MYWKHCKPISMRYRTISGLSSTYLQTLLVLRLLLVYYSQTEIDLICLVKLWRHAHDLGKCLFCMIEGSIAVIEYSDAIPQFGFL